MFNEETYQPFSYDMLGMTTANFVGELNIPVFWIMVAQLPS